MNLHYKDHHHQRYCKGAQKIHLFAQRLSRLCFTSRSCTYKVFVAIEMLTCDITGSHSLTKTASYCERFVKVWANVQPGSLCHSSKNSLQTSNTSPLPTSFTNVWQKMDYWEIKYRLESANQWASVRSTFFCNNPTPCGFDHLAIQYLPVTDLTKVTGKAGKVQNTNTYNKR